MKQLQHDLQFRRQIRQDGSDSRVRLGLQQRLQRTWPGVLSSYGQQMFQARIIRRLAAPLAGADAACPMPGDGVEPAGELTGILQLRQHPKRQEQGLLRHVLCRLTRIQALLGHQDDRASKTSDQFIVGLQAAQARDLDEIPIAQRLKAAHRRHVPGSLRPTRDNGEGKGEWNA